MVSVSRLIKLGLFSLALGALPVAAAEAPPAPVSVLSAVPSAVACAAPVVLTPIEIAGLLAEPLATPDLGGTAPAVRFASCSGDDCGCYNDPCEDQCPPGNQPCITQCVRGQIRCARACCSDF